MSLALLGIFVALMFVGVPIAVALGVACITSVLLFTQMPLSMMVQSMFTAMNSFVMVAVPLFILTGTLMDESGVADRIYNFANACVGWIFGGLGHVAIMTGLIFAGMSGSSVAEIASIGRMSINSLSKKGYPRDYAVAINLTSSMLATVIPPSILMIIAASVANISIGQALMAGLVPGIFMGVIFMLYNYYFCKKHNIGDRAPFSLKVLGSTFLSALPALLIPIILLGGMMTGLYTPTEAAGIAATYTIIISMFVYRSLKWSQLPGIIARTARSTGTILFVAITAKPAAMLFELDGLPAKIAGGLAALSSDPVIVMLIIFAFLIMVGMFMDATAAIYILVPILLPAVISVGVDSLFFVVILVIALAFGLITPPVGVCLYAAAEVSGLPIEKIVTASIPWLVISVVMIVAFIVFEDAVMLPVQWMFH